MAQVYLSLGYDTERPHGEWAETEKGRDLRKRQIDLVRKLTGTLDREDVPRTFFILGHYLERCLDDFSKEELRGVYNRSNHLSEIQQHTYSHIILRDIEMWEGRDVASLEEFLGDVSKANCVLAEILGVFPNGLRTPVGYHHDLSDMPGVVEGLGELGMTYVSSDLRTEHSLEGPLRMERQPHSYEHIGYPGIFEIPSSGFQDVMFTEDFGERFLGEEMLFGSDDEAVEYFTDLFKHANWMAEQTSPVFVSLCLHPWAVMEYDPELEIHKRVIDSARGLGIEIVPYGSIPHIQRNGDVTS